MSKISVKSSDRATWEVLGSKVGALEPGVAARSLGGAGQNGEEVLSGVCAGFKRCMLTEINKLSFLV